MYEPWLSYLLDVKIVTKVLNITSQFGVYYIYYTRYLPRIHCVLIRKFSYGSLMMQLVNLNNETI